MIEFAARPTAALIRAHIIAGLQARDRIIDLRWGENWIEVEWTPYGLIGHGWIGKHSGQDIADDIARKFPALLEA
jgi:hypothetical protein